MAIKETTTGGGMFRISEPGEYAVEITSVQTGLSKSGDPMTTIEFKTHDDKKIKAFYVKKHPFMAKALEELKKACGLKPTDETSDLLTKKCGILVKLGKPKEDGTTWTEVRGYGSVDQVEKSKVDELPF